MENRMRVVCPENEELGRYMLQKRQEMAEKPKGISENVDMTLSKAYANICNSKNAIKTLKDLSQIKGVGKWLLKLLKEFFGNDSDSGSAEPEDLTKKGKKNKGTKRYVPQKNSVAYALLITLYRGTTNGKEFMRKQELIDAAEASGLSKAPIAPEKGKGKPAQFGSSARDWYSGWSCMTTLVTKGLVAKSSCPAKYMLTQEGQEVAQECLMRSRLVDPREIVADTERPSNLGTSKILQESSPPALAREATVGSAGSRGQEKSIDVPLELLERFMRMGYSKEKVVLAFAEVLKTTENKDIASLWPAVMCHLREDQVYGFHSEFPALGEDGCASATSFSLRNGQVELVKSQSIQKDLTFDSGPARKLTGSPPNSISLRACSSSELSAQKPSSNGLESNINALTLPPLSFGEKFEDAYQVILILDDREQFATRGSRKIVEHISSEFKIQIEVRRLPVGDCIWIARHKFLHSEYVLDFIVERKKIDDLRTSIRDSRYKEQKLRLLRCGLKKLIYFVEGDPNCSEAAESIKTACFTTEILEGFDVQRTSSLPDTLRKYGFLTQAIAQYYKSLLPDDQSKHNGVCPPFDEFVKRCQDLDKMTVSDVFAVQLMQVPQVTEEVAIAVLDLYPTLLSLAQAYSLLDGDVSAQEEMLTKQSNNAINAVASRNIFQLVWGN
ncbi:crossover junction endonuclease MUS81 [Tripterygium wilfordii]|uniref:Crossover junction endonuclease MUS81 n=1 Tax=Tripterygium wilfordii TaxID=458696 RepID=A0A7J7CHV9_TRIWF|nr:crossover junction endonuclease MUS81 [Tripterygium wilfordii]KAF5733621.1 crossover junction endonuclease MUS81 [Tripterygium wilfordii]